MSLRLVSPAIASEMLDVWFKTPPDPSERDNIALLERARQKEREQRESPLPTT